MNECLKSNLKSQNSVSNRLSALETNKSTSDRPPSMSFACTECGLLFTSEDYLRTHVDSHAKENHSEIVKHD